MAVAESKNGRDFGIPNLASVTALASIKVSTNNVHNALVVAQSHPRAASLTIYADKNRRSPFKKIK